jgi:hypothetical protein
MLRNRIALGTLLLSAAAVVSCSDSTTTPTQASADRGSAVSPNLKKDKQRAELLTNIPVTETLSDGRLLKGTLTVTRFDFVQSTRSLTVSGVLNYTVTNADGTGAQTGSQQFSRIPTTLQRGEEGATSLVTPAAFRVVCDILFLDIGAIHLDLLGLTLDLSRIILDLNAVSGTGNLLGNLLCALVGLLDGVGTLAAILQLLERINDILSGLGGLGATGASMMLLPAQLSAALLPVIT